MRTDFPTGILRARRAKLTALLFACISAGILGFSSIKPLHAQDADDAVRQLVLWETQGNAASQRSPEALQIEHYEIPLESVEADFSAGLPPEIRRALVFERGGKSFVRWIVNPEDSQYSHDVMEFLFGRVRGIPQKQKYFTGYLTASRSMIVEDPASGARFSVKVSTNWTGGDWKDKKQTFADAKWIRTADEYLRERAKVTRPEKFKVLEEPAVFGIPSLDQAMVVRSLGDLPAREHYYLPGFTALHEEVGRKIALVNGASDPAKYWNENYNKPLARAAAELAARFGLTFDSPHSQNFLIELDQKLKPTGRIIFRDLADTYAQKQFFEAIGREDFLKKWNSSAITDGELKVGIGLLMGNQSPSWLDTDAYRAWGGDFFREFESRYSVLTGVPEKELNHTPFLRPWSKNAYYGKFYKTSSEAFVRYFRHLGKSCEDLFKEH